MLSLSTKGRYATRIMVCLARKSQRLPIPIQEIAASEGVPPGYIEQILMKLRVAGLVRSHRGSRGGFSLARDAATISVGQVLVATEGPICIAPCLRARCKRASACPTKPLWQKANDALTQTFDEISVAEISRPAAASLAPSGVAFDI